MHLDRFQLSATPYERVASSIYLSSGVAARFIGDVVDLLLKRGVLPCLGASGGVFALVSVCGCAGLSPETPPWYLLPVYAWVFFPFLFLPVELGLLSMALGDVIGISLRPLWVNNGVRVGHETNLAAMTVGAAYIFGKQTYVDRYERKVYWWYRHEEILQKCHRDEQRSH